MCLLKCEDILWIVFVLVGSDWGISRSDLLPMRSRLPENFCTPPFGGAEAVESSCEGSVIWGYTSGRKYF